MTVLFQIPVGIGSDIRQLVNSEFFVYLVPFLLTFAIVYGFLSHAGIPSNKQVRSVISLLLGFAVLPLAPTMVGFLSPVASSLLLVVSSILVFIILLEIVGLRESKEYEGNRTQNPQTGEVKEAPKYKYEFFKRHGAGFGLLLITTAALIFGNAGGFELLGVKTPTFFLNAPLLFFLVVVLLIVYFVALK